MVYHPCPRCGRLVPVGVSYCAACRPEAEAQAAEAIERRRAYKQQKYNKIYNKKRDPKYLTFYRSKDWKALSRAYLQAKEYKCEAQLEGCKHLAVEVHHKDPIQTSTGWDRRLDWDNLEAVCVSCHNRRHNKSGKAEQPGVIDLRTIER